MSDVALQAFLLPPSPLSHPKVVLLLLLFGRVKEEDQKQPCPSFGAIVRLVSRAASYGKVPWPVICAKITAAQLSKHRTPLTNSVWCAFQFSVLRLAAYPHMRNSLAATVEIKG